MKFVELIDKYIESRAKVSVNGMSSRDGGRIVKREGDFIRFEIVKEAEKQEDFTKELVVIPLGQVFSISKGKRKVATLDALA